MAIIGGTDNDDVVEGTNERDLLIGEGGNDTLIGGLGDDELIGGPGEDIAVFGGVRADFGISVYNTFQFESAVVRNGTQGRDEVHEIEILRFDDGDFVLSALLDDFGETPETAGSFKTFPENEPPRFDANGIIGFDGDRDLFLTPLSPATFYRLTVFDSWYEGKFSVTVRDPDGNLIVDIDNPKDNVLEFETTSAGDYHITVSSYEGGTGQYTVRINELVLVGSDDDDVLLGTTGADTFYPGAGLDRIYGEGGIDVVVIDSNRDDFIIEHSRPYDLSPNDSVRVYVGFENPNSKTLEDVEIIRFNDQDYHILDYLDDFGDTLETAGHIVESDLNFAWAGDLMAQGRIDVTGDTDLFKVDLVAGQTFSFEFRGYQSSDFFEVTSISDADGAAVETRQSVTGNYLSGDPTFFRAAQSGTYLFSFAGRNGAIGDYTLDLKYLQMIGTDALDDLQSSPFDDIIEGGQSGDFINLIIEGNDIVDGGDGNDFLEVFVPEEDFEISVRDDDAIIISASTGTATVMNVESFVFMESGHYTDLEVNLDDLLLAAAELPNGTEINIHLTDDHEAVSVAGRSNDIHQGTWRDDVIEDAGGRNIIYANGGYDKVGLLSGTNIVDGGAGRDLIIGGIGHDDLSGGRGSDVILGDISKNHFGSDTIYAGEGADLLEGGGGRDVFVFRIFEGDNTIGEIDIDYDVPSNSVVVGPDFESGLDKIQVEGFDYKTKEEAFARITEIDGVATFIDHGTLITFAGLTIADLSPDDFIIV